MEDDLNFFLKNQNEDLKKKEDYLKKNGRRPPNKMEDDLKKKWKTTSKGKKLTNSSKI